VGDQVKLSVVASGTPAPTFQWYVDGTKIDGATDSTFSAAATKATLGKYSVTVTNINGSTTSNIVTVSETK
jgi:hypothetical protein